ncbi:glucosamine-6-phosphate deaminase [symbiont of Argiope bruennichi]|uniref:glucosamine-6-phosphate deaminase n=1 Tax=symbiont of Argiope bruennichi TaxID=2810479 RepID=UPI003DA60F23
MKIHIFKTESEASEFASKIFLDHLNHKKNSVFCFATGRSPIHLYKNFVLNYQKNLTDWSKVVTFNLDEYVGYNGTEKNSYRKFMNDHLFSKININLENTYVPNGIGDLEKNCFDFEKNIINHHGIDVLLLGLGVNGHIGFNEPNTPFSSLTHVVKLHEQSLKDHAKHFFNNNINEVPKEAVTMGIKSIMNAKKIVLLAFGETKTNILQKLIENEVTKKVPASVLQLHPDCHVICDQIAASKLTNTSLYNQLHFYN